MNITRTRVGATQAPPTSPAPAWAQPDRDGVARHRCNITRTRVGTTSRSRRSERRERHHPHPHGCNLRVPTWPWLPETSPAPAWAQLQPGVCIGPSEYDILCYYRKKGLGDCILRHCLCRPGT